MPSHFVVIIQDLIEKALDLSGGYPIFLNIIE